MAKKRKDCATTIPQNPPAQGRRLELFTHTGNLHKPQISTIPGISVKQRDRYQVVLNDVVLGDRLTLDEAIALANQSTHL